MHIQSIGRRQFAFGMTWTERKGVDLDEAAREALRLSDEAPLGRVRTTARSRRGKNAAGAAGFLQLDDGQRGAVFSAAEALASRFEDGLFVMSMADGENLWFCGVRDHTVLVGYDSIAPAEDVVGKVLAMSSVLKLPLYVEADLLTHPAFVGGDRCTELAIADAIAKAKIKPLARMGVNPALLGVVGAVVAVGVAYVVFSGPSQDTQEVSPEEQRQQSISAYVEQAKTSIGAYAADSTWALEALRTMEREMPPALAGWHVATFACDPTQCLVEYARAGSGAYAVSPFTERFGVQSVALNQDGKSLVVSRPLSLPRVEVTEDWLRQLQPADVVLADWLGRIPLGMDGGSVSGVPVVNQLDQSLGGSAIGMPKLVMEQVSVNGSSFLGARPLASIVEQGAAGGFRIARFTWSPNIESPSWNITWSRVHG